MTHELFYAQAAAELESGNINRPLKVKAYAESDGDEKRAAAWYIRHRAIELEKIAADQFANEVINLHDRKRQIEQDQVTILARLEQDGWYTANDELLQWGKRYDWPKIEINGIVEIPSGHAAWTTFTTEALSIKVQQVLWSILNLKTDDWNQYGQTQL